MMPMLTHEEHDIIDNSLGILKIAEVMFRSRLTNENRSVEEAMRLHRICLQLAAFLTDNRPLPYTSGHGHQG